MAGQYISHLHHEMAQMSIRVHVITRSCLYWLDSLFYMQMTVFLLITISGNCLIWSTGGQKSIIEDGTRARYMKRSTRMEAELIRKGLQRIWKVGRWIGSCCGTGGRAKEVLEGDNRDVRTTRIPLCLGSARTKPTPTYLMADARSLDGGLGRGHRKRRRRGIERTQGSLDS